MLVGACILDVLAIHPVADGNGRLARLMTTYELISQGYGVARYVSLEQRIYDSKNTYYQRQRAMPGVSPATIRLVLNELRDSGNIIVDGGGPSARWRRQ